MRVVSLCFHKSSYHSLLRVLPRFNHFLIFKKVFEAVGIFNKSLIDEISCCIIYFLFSGCRIFLNLGTYLCFFLSLKENEVVGFVVFSQQLLIGVIFCQVRSILIIAPQEKIYCENTMKLPLLYFLSMIRFFFTFLLCD